MHAYPYIFVCTFVCTFSAGCVNRQLFANTLAIKTIIMSVQHVKTAALLTAHITNLKSS